MARRLLAPAVAARACQPRPQRCASPLVARGWEHCPPALLHRDRQQGEQTDRRQQAPGAYRKRNLLFIVAGRAVPRPGLHSALLLSG